MTAIDFGALTFISTFNPLMFNFSSNKENENGNRNGCIW